jgi:hypothetical protein
MSDDTPEFESYLNEAMEQPIVTPEADEYDLDTYHK